MRLTQRAENIVLPLAAVVIALIIGAVLIWLDGANPFDGVQGAARRGASAARTTSPARSRSRPR